MRRLALAALALTFSAAGASGQKAPSAPALKWGPAPAVFPKGAKMAVVSGDPGKAGTFTIDLSLPGGYRFMPHFHPTAEHVTVKKGTFQVGMGDKFDLAQAHTMAVGDTGTIPALAHHYAEAKGKTLVEVTAEGPFAMTYVNPADDPSHAKVASAMKTAKAAKAAKP